MAIRRCGSVEREPGADLGLVVDVALAADVDDDLVDRAAGERERCLVLGGHRRGAVAPDADAVTGQAEVAGLGDDRRRSRRLRRRRRASACPRCRAWPGCCWGRWPTKSAAQHVGARREARASAIDVLERGADPVERVAEHAVLDVEAVPAGHAAGRPDDAFDVAGVDRDAGGDRVRAAGDRGPADSGTSAQFG